MKKIVSVSLMGLFALSVASANPAFADDNKMVAGAKAVGKGIMWGPKKLGEGLKKGFTAMGNGFKKMTGK
ncbi:MAG: hypothetical protein K2X81_14515 [Candidatus Obscuribacterales bacterium]|nr:hypothetical protein [Candidatus Obscuribacterales bacterium]